MGSICWGRLAIVAAALFAGVGHAQLMPSPTELDTLGLNNERPSVIHNGLGAVWTAIWASNNTLDGTIGSDLDILVARTLDNGGDWSAPVAVNSDAETDSAVDFNPTIAALGEGILVAAWTRTAQGADADIFVARSFDAGASWTTPEALNSNAVSDTGFDGDPLICVINPSTVVCVWNSNDTLGGLVGEDYDILFSRSADFGATWSTVGILNSSAASDTGDDRKPAIATDGAGTVVCAWESTTDLGGIGTDIDIQFARSTDGGATWGPTGPLADVPGLDGTEADTDVALAADGMGNWMAVWTSAADLGGMWGFDQDIFVSVSTTNAATWNPVDSPDTEAHTDSSTEANPAIDTDGRGTWVVAWDSNRTTLDHDLFFARTSNKGAAWADPAPLRASDDVVGNHFVALASDGAGRWGAAWSTAANIVKADVGVLTGGAAGAVRDIGALDGLSCAAVVAESADGTVALATPTDIPGRYAFLQLPVGLYDITAFAPGFESAVQTGVQILPDATSIFDFALTPRPVGAPYVIFGRVVDSATGDPLIAARVDAFEGAVLVASTFTCGDGDYEIVLPDLPKGGERSITLEFTSNGYDAAEAMGLVAQNVPLEVNVDLVKAIAEIGTLTGSVVTTAFTAIADARVDLVSGASLASTTTNESGVFLFDALIAGVYTVRASAEGFASGQSGNVSVGGGVRQTFLVLQSQAIEGGIAVSIEPPEALAAGGAWRRVGTAQWFGGGSVVMAPGDFTIEFRDVEGYATPDNRSVTVTAGETTEELATYLPIGSSDPADVNSDGLLNAVDVQIVINAALGIGSVDGDVNQDGGTNAVDVQIVINAVLTGS